MKIGYRRMAKGLASLAILAIGAAFCFSALFPWLSKGVLPTTVLLLTTVITLLVCGTVSAEPSTQYKLADIENARENVKQYEWARDIVDEWKASTTSVMAKSRSEIDELIPDLTPGTHYGQNCPHCVGKQSLMGNGQFDWDADRPDEIACASCGMVFPNKEYPETGVLECPKLGQRFTYYETKEELENPEKRNEHALKWLGDQPTMTSFTGHIRDRKVDWARSQCLTLAKLYAITEEPAYAERVVWILDRFACVYPNYLYHSYDGSVADLDPAEVAENMGKIEAEGGSRGGRFPKETVRHAYGLHQFENHSELFNGFWGAGRMSVHGKGSDAGPIFYLAVAYDLIRDAKDGSGNRILDGDAEQRILEDLILAGCRDMEHWVSLSNKGTAVYGLSATVGILRNEPERVHRAWELFQRMLAERYHHDGFYSESPGYSAHNFSNVREAADLLHGYSDPEGYEPEDGRRFENVDMYTGGRFNLSLQSLMRQLAPGRMMPVIGDTLVNAHADILSAEVLACRAGGDFVDLLEIVQDAPLSEKGSEYALWYRPPNLTPTRSAELPLNSEWFPGWHVGVLRGGRAKDNALYLNGNEHNWTVETNHRQQDILSVCYWAYGKEMATDRGYFSGSGQLLPDGRGGQVWTKSSLSHNLVVVDEEEQATRESGSNLELFGIAPGVEVMQASGHNAYPQCEEYRRTLVIVNAPGGASYVVALFRVKGGKIHQYNFHSDGIPGGHESLGLQPAEVSETWGKWLERPQSILPEGTTTLTWDNEGVNLELTLMNEADRVILADAPGWRLGTPEELAKPPVRQVLVEYRAEEGAPLATQFASLIAPYEAEASPIRSARMLVNDTESGVVALEVQLEGRTDYIISTKDQEVREYGPVSAGGEFALVSVDAEGKAIQGYLIKGTTLKCGELEIALPAATTAVKVASTEGKTWVLDEELDEHEELIGNYAIVGNGPVTGFQIESATGKSVSVRDYPALPCDSIEILRSEWVGE